MPIRGNYGAITELDVPAAEARERVLTMAQRFGVREFQFYDIVPSYSPPVSGHDPLHPQWQHLYANASACWRAEAWLPNYMRNASKCRYSLDAYINAIHQIGGRAWLYAQVCLHRSLM